MMRYLRARTTGSILSTARLTRISPAPPLPSITSVGKSEPPSTDFIVRHPIVDIEFIFASTIDAGWKDDVTHRSADLAAGFRNEERVGRAKDDTVEPIRIVDDDTRAIPQQTRAAGMLQFVGDVNH